MVKDKKVRQVALGFLSVFIFLVFTFNVSAQDASEELVFKQNQEINLIKPCFNNGTLCSSSTSCNSTVTNPDSQVILRNSPETNQLSFYNISIPSSNASVLGTYTTLRVCHDPVGQIIGNGYETYTFIVTASGTNDDSIGYLIMLGFSFVLSLGLIVFGFSKDDPTTVILGSFALTLLGLFTMLNGIGNFRNDLTLWSSVIVIFIGAYVSVRSGMEMMNA